MDSGAFAVVHRTVLIAEDSDQQAATLEIALLAIPGLSVIHATTGQEALRVLESATGAGISALVTDLAMPRMDGFELVERLRGDPRFRRLPIIVVSADTNPRTPARVEQLGADAFFPKPYSPAALRAKLERLLHEHQD